MSKIQCTEFVKRQTAESPFSFFADMSPCEAHPMGRTADWRTLETHIEECMESPDKLEAKISAGYKPGVVIVSIPGHGWSDFRFYSGVMPVTAQTSLSARFAARRDGEAPFIDVVARGAKTPATHVDVVLYSRALLVEEGEQVPVDVDYQIVSINARTQDAPEPMSPMAMARNFLGLTGGTKAEYTAEQFAQAILYWSTHAMHGGGQ